MLRRSIVFALALGGLLALTGEAHAGGFEFPAPGTRALGRGGAFHARADEPLALLYNPANLAALPGLQAQLDLHLVMYDVCFDRDGTYTDEVGAGAGGTRFGSPNDEPSEGGYQDVPYPNVCNDVPVSPVPEVAFTLRPIEELGIGIGLVAPAGVGSVEMGNAKRGTVSTDLHPEGELPSPGRYLMVEQSLLIVYPSIGVGYAPHPRFRFGATFGSGIGVFDFKNMGRPTPGEDFSSDILTDLHATDYFIPRVTVSAHAVPHDNLDVMAGFTWNDDVEADGTLSVITQFYNDTHFEERLGRHGGETVERCPDDYDDAELCGPPIDDVKLKASQPWQIAFGIRYADRIHPRSRDSGAIGQLSGDVEDPMANERWDVELDVVYERNSRLDAFRVDIPPGTEVAPNALGPVGLPEQLVLPHNWQDQVSVRLGGDYNILPGKLAARMGFSFETRGVDDEYANVDFTPFMRYGLHAGLTARFGRFDLSLAYAHIFQKDVVVKSANTSEGSLTPAEAGDPSARDCMMSDTGCVVDGQTGVPQTVASFATGGSPPTIVNAGRFTSSFDVVSLGLRYNF